MTCPYASQADPKQAERPAPPLAASRVSRWLLAGAGLVSVGVGAVGVFVPGGLPTTVFLLIAAWCFTRSCPWLERRLVRARIFAPYLAYLDGAVPPRRSRVVASLLLWGFGGTSLVTLAAAGTAPAWLGLLFAACVVGTFFIWRWRAGGRVAEVR